MPSNDLRTPRKQDKDDPPSISLRRLRDAPFDTLQRMSDEFGHRPATSLTEARAAALLDGRLRRAGLQVIADTFSAAPRPGWTGVVAGVLACVAVGTYYWLPLLTLGLAVVVLLITGVALAQPDLVAAKPRPSQNVVANRAASDEQRYRLVLLARVDTPLVPAMLTLALGGPQIARLRIAAAIALNGIALVGLFDPRRLWLYLLALPALYLVVAAISDILAMRPFGPSQPRDSAGVAVLLSASEQLDSLEHTELWAIGLGATAQHAGLQDLLRRYPFDSTKTLFVALEGLGNGAPAIVTAEGWPQATTPDSQLEDMLVALGQAPEHAAPSISTATPTLCMPLLHEGRRAICLACLGPQSGAAQAIEQEHLERATQLVVALAHAIDQWK